MSRVYKLDEFAVNIIFQRLFCKYCYIQHKSLRLQFKIYKKALKAFLIDTPFLADEISIKNDNKIFGNTWNFA